MNKKFFTLIVGLLLAVCGTVNAQPATVVLDAYKDGNYVLLGNAATDQFISVDVTIPGQFTYQVVDEATALADFKSLAAALWRVQILKPAGSPVVKYVYTNRLTGVILSTSSASAYTSTSTPAIGSAAASMPINGNISEWNNTTATGIDVAGAVPMSYYSGSSDITYMVESNGFLVTYKEPVSTPQTYAQTAFKVQPYTINEMNLTAEDLNSELWTKPGSTSFQLSYNPTVSAGFTNLFTATKFTATNVGMTGYVNLKSTVGTDKYLLVDTAYHVGTELSSKLIKMGTDKLNADYRNPKSYNFAFQYHPEKDSIAIQVEEYFKRQQTATVLTPSLNTYWYAPASPNPGYDEVVDAAVRIAQLYDTRVLSFSNQTNGIVYTATPGATRQSDVDQNTLVLLGNVTGPGFTTMADGIYLIKNKSTKATVLNQTYPNNGEYLIKNLAGYSGWAPQEVQDFHNMPAAQWVVKQDATGILTSSIAIENREFNDMTNDGVYISFPPRMQLYSVAGDATSAWYYTGDADNMIDTITFIPVRDQVTKTIGYKYVPQDSVLVEKYLLSYLNKLAMGKYVTTESHKDSLVRVDPKDGKMSFQLEYAAKDDYYGADSLKRNAYYIRVKDATKLNYDNRCLVYDAKLKKYVISENEKQAFFIKENNFKDAIHYYALVEASVLDYVLAPAANTEYTDANGVLYAAGAKMPVYKDINGKAIAVGVVTDNVTDADLLPNYFVYKKVSGSVTKENLLTFGGLYSGLWPDVVDTYPFASAQYSTNYKVSVEDATANLTQGSYDNVFDGSEEVRTSAFSVEMDNTPLYRRFDADAKLGEAHGNAGNSPLWLKFNKWNDKKQYLGENSPGTALENGVGRYRNDLKDTSISFLGLFNADSYPEAATNAYTMYVDTAYVRNATIMPQYLLGIRPTFQKADTVWCGETHTSFADSLACIHTIITQKSTRAMWLINATDSARNAANADYLGKKQYGSEDMVRLAFVDGIHARDTFFVLRGANALLPHDSINLNRMVFAAGDKIALNNNNHKNVVFSFRLIDDANRRFLMESYSGRLNNKKHDADTNEGIAPRNGGWVKINNGVPVMTYSDLKTAVDGEAEIFDVVGGTENGAVANENVATTSVQVIGANGSVIVKGAVGKQVVISNILGQTIANTVLTSDNQAISTPQGVVIVAVQGEKAVKAMVK